jgi:hypothetical protein
MNIIFNAQNINDIKSLNTFGYTTLKYPTIAWFAMIEKLALNIKPKITL